MSIIKLSTHKKRSFKKLELIEEILPNIKKYEGETIIIHLDGEILYEDELLKKFAEDVVLLKKFGANPFIIHGGVKYVEEYFNRFNLEFKVDEGIIVTNKDSIKMLEMILKGFVSSRIVTAINKAGGLAVGLSGKDGNLIEAKKFRKSRARPNSNIENLIDFGFNGEPTIVNPEILLSFEESKLIPVISPIASGENIETLHINSLITSSIIASSLVASRYIIFTDKKGIIDSNGKLIEYIASHDFIKYKNDYYIEKQIKENIICVLENQVAAVYILNGTVSHALLLSLFTHDKVGTLIEAPEDEELML